MNHRPVPGTTSFAFQLQANIIRCIHRAQKKNSRAVGYLIQKVIIFIVNNSCVFISSETDHPGVPVVKNYKTVCCKSQTELDISYTWLQTACVHDIAKRYIKLGWLKSGDGSQFTLHIWNVVTLISMSSQSFSLLYAFVHTILRYNVVIVFFFTWDCGLYHQTLEAAGSEYSSAVGLEHPNFATNRATE